MREHFMPVTRTARYVTRGDPATAKRVCFVCHGYRQLASRFIRYFSVLDDGSTYVVAPEGLSRFYLDDTEGEHGPGAKVGATWMTREDRLNEINDYVRYLDKLYDDVFDNIDRDSVRVIAVGFSQGVATVSRWVDAGHPRVDHVILWGSYLPQDVDLSSPHAALRQTKLSLVFGDKDELLTQERMAAQEKRLAECQIEYDLVRFDGGHHLNKHVLKDLTTSGGGSNR